ncbi:MAG: hypothetical protein NWE76_09020, partial [Candidatus Bathyarchaeota archaeon]|nr:hypothetical protein [Candidatus Bathyarchaeota archaeon]
VRIIHRIMVQERGDRGIEFGNRNHPQICNSARIPRGVLFFGSENVPKNSIPERPQLLFSAP